MSSSSLISTPSARRKASGQGLPPFSSTVAAFAHSTASAMPGGFASGFCADFADRLGDRAGGGFGDVAGAQHDDRGLALGVGIGDPVVDAAAAQRLGKLARAVGGQYHERLGA